MVHSMLGLCAQSDLKQAVAYSSVVHMNAVLLGLCAGTMDSMLGSVQLALLHGLISPALFLLTASTARQVGCRFMAGMLGGDIG